MSVRAASPRDASITSAMARLLELLSPRRTLVKARAAPTRVARSGPTVAPAATSALIAPRVIAEESASAA